MSLQSHYDNKNRGGSKLDVWSAPQRGRLNISQDRSKSTNLCRFVLIVSLISSALIGGCTRRGALLTHPLALPHPSSPSTTPERIECPASSPPWVMWTGALLATVSLTGLLWSDRCSVPGSSGDCRFYFQREPWWGRLFVVGIATTVTGYAHHRKETQRVCLFEHLTPPTVSSSGLRGDQVH